MTPEEIQRYKKYGSPDLRLIEECSEVIHAICKGIRFGYDNYHPDTRINNRDHIADELVDLDTAILNFRKYIAAIPRGSDDKMEGPHSEFITEVSKTIEKSDNADVKPGIAF